jgi:N-acetylneuraminic acid mutarotase
MVIWAGDDGQAGALDTGAIYDPGGDSWTTMSTSLAPAARSEHRAIWTGTALIVFGGTSDGESSLADGGIFDPIGNSWSTLDMTNGPSGRLRHAQVWTGSEMLVWGGGYSGAEDGGLYAP